MHTAPSRLHSPRPSSGSVQPLVTVVVLALSLTLLVLWQIPPMSPFLLLPPSSSIDLPVAVPCKTYPLIPSPCLDEQQFIPMLVAELEGEACNQQTLLDSPASACKPREWVIVDVGVNKGYLVAEFVVALGVDVHRTPQSVRNAAHEYLQAVVGLDVLSLDAKEQQFWETMLCGACGDCVRPHQMKKMQKKRRRRRKITVYGYDPVQPNINFLKSYWSKQPVSSEDDVKVHLTWAAVSNHTNLADPQTQPRMCQTFARESTRLEEADCAVERSRNSSFSCYSGCTYAPVPVVALDDVLEPHVKYVDVLISDTEGHDYEVARGARRLLSSGKVALYIFEMHAATGLRQHISFLSSVGYVCFLPEGHEARGFTEISGACWKDEYETWHGWTNAVCVHSKFRKMLARLRA